MGRKQTRSGKYVYFYITSLIFLLLSSCAVSKHHGIKVEDWEEAYASLPLSRDLLAQGNYEGALKENQKLLTLPEYKPYEDKALFNIGLIYAHPRNPQKDYGKAINSFKRLMQDHPQSPLFEQAKIWTGILQENEKLTQMLERSKWSNIKIEGHGEILELLLRGQELLAQGDYEGALRENQKALSLSEHTPLEDEALFYIGLIYAHPGNPKKDYGKAINSFKRLMQDHPQSPLFEQAKIWTGILQENEKLTQMLERSKEVDIEIEKKKKEKEK